MVTADVAMLSWAGGSAVVIHQSHHKLAHHDIRPRASFGHDRGDYSESGAQIAMAATSWNFHNPTQPVLRPALVGLTSCPASEVLV